MCTALGRAAWALMFFANVLGREHCQLIIDAIMDMPDRKTAEEAQKRCGAVGAGSSPRVITEAVRTRRRPSCMAEKTFDELWPW